jgi:hypothetical protein
VTAMLFFLTSCGISPDESKGLDCERLLRVDLDVYPDKWKAGDSIDLMIQSISKIDTLIPKGPEVAIPYAHMAKFNFDGPSVTVRWATDSVIFLNSAGRYFLLAGTFINIRDNIVLRTESRWTILQDSADFFYLQPDQNSYKIDTFPVN